MNTSKEKILSILQTVTDPEIPVLSVIDLGIIRDIILSDGPSGQNIEIVVTPTYSGCPAMEVISTNIKRSLLENGFIQPIITTILSPAWTTDWMSAAGKDKLKAYGIAAPLATQAICTPRLFVASEAIPCPRCNSHDTRWISEFGSTPCKALLQCNDCHEPFDYFKCH